MLQNGPKTLTVAPKNMSWKNRTPSLDHLKDVAKDFPPINFKAKVEMISVLFSWLKFTKQMFLTMSDVNCKH